MRITIKEFTRDLQLFVGQRGAGHIKYRPGTGDFYVIPTDVVLADGGLAEEDRVWPTLELAINTLLVFQKYIPNSEHSLHGELRVSLADQDLDLILVDVPIPDMSGPESLDDLAGGDAQKEDPCAVDPGWAD